MDNPFIVSFFRVWIVFSEAIVSAVRAFGTEPKRETRVPFLGNPSSFSLCREVLMADERAYEPLLR